MGDNDAALQEMAAQLATNLRVQGGRGREMWSQVHEKLAEIAATFGQDQKAAVQAVMEVARDASSSQDFMKTLQKRVQANMVKDFVYHVAHQLNMTPLADSKPVHMVDEHSNFCEENVDNIVHSSCELSQLNAPYAVVSIVGAQSSGKSFLLNCLFGTKFPVMDSNSKRCQTTRGIMMSRCIGPSLILLDVEGSDGIERRENTSFERQAALFALTVSDLMMVNILAGNVGLEQGSGNPLFRTIFEERTKLPGGITKLIVVLRQYSGEPNIKILENQVLENLQEIWKTANREKFIFEDYIKVVVVGLPEKKSSEFQKEVMALRRLLSDQRTAKEPAASFSISSSNFWNTIKQNKELDIPSHKVLVAKLHCRRLVEDTIKSLKSREEYILLKSENSGGCFEEISHKLMESIKAEYDEKTVRYDQDVRDNEREHLVEELNAEFHIVEEERKARVIKKRNDLIKYGVPVASVVANIGYDLATGDFLSPIFRSARFLWNKVTHDDDSDIPSGSHDDLIDLS